MRAESSLKLPFAERTAMVGSTGVPLPDPDHATRQAESEIVFIIEGKDALLRDPRCPLVIPLQIGAEDPKGRWHEQSAAFIDGTTIRHAPLAVKAAFGNYGDHRLTAIFERHFDVGPVSACIHPTPARLKLGRQ